MTELTELETRTFRLAPADELDIIKTFECGQCFRWNAGEDGAYSGCAYGHAAKVFDREGFVYIRTDGGEELWRDYFDIGRDYAAISRGFKGGEYLDACIAEGMGIRILRQEPWEALCSFIISQCNNIKRIKGIVETLCRSFGESFSFEGETFWRFPDAERLARLEPEDLAVLHSGYRAPYIISAARAVADGSIDLDALIDADWREAKAELVKLSGVGEKVANCAVLFGLRHMEAFPIDVWIRRALREHFPPDFDPASLGDYAGLAQQYIFYSARGAG